MITSEIPTLVVVTGNVSSAQNCVNDNWRALDSIECRLAYKSVLLLCVYPLGIQVEEGGMVGILITTGKIT